MLCPECLPVETRSGKWEVEGRPGVLRTAILAAAAYDMPFDNGVAYYGLVGGGSAVVVAWDWDRQLGWEANAGTQFYRR